MKYQILFFLVTLAIAGRLPAASDYYAPLPFGDADRFALDSDNLAIGEWWRPVKAKGKDKWQDARAWLQSIERDQALAFALYTQD